MSKFKVVELIVLEGNARAVAEQIVAYTAAGNDIGFKLSPTIVHFMAEKMNIEASSITELFADELDQTVLLWCSW